MSWHNAYVKRLVAIDKVYDKAGDCQELSNAIDDLLTEAGTRIDSEVIPSRQRVYGQQRLTRICLHYCSNYINGSKAEVTG